MKQKLVLFMAIVFALGLVSCNKTKELTVSNVKIEGEDPDVFKVVDGTYTLDGEEGLSIGIRIELVNTLEKVEEVDLGGDDFALQLLDKDGEDINGGTLKLSRKEKQKLADFVQGKNGSSIDIVFKDKDTEDVSKVLKEADSFMLVNVTCHPKYIPFHKGAVKIEGTAGGAPFTMVLKYKDGIVYGDYYYNKVGPSGKIALKGKYHDGHLKMAEYINGYVCYWDMNYQPEDNGFAGKFIRWDGREFSPVMHIVGNTTYDGPIPTFTLDEGAFSGMGVSSTSSATSSGDYDWDEWLDDYEEAMDQLIKIYKKADKGDPSALADYTEYLDKVNDLVEEGENASGTMNAEQLKRYERITKKMEQVK